MDISSQYRFEGSVFFVYDREALKKEEDRLEDAIIYFYPHSMPIDNQCLLCGQLIGLVQFIDEIFSSAPVLYRFKKEKIAVKHVGCYTFALAGSCIEPDNLLIEQLDRLYDLFAFYHGSVDQVKLDCDNDTEFLSEIYSLLEQYLGFIHNYGDKLPSVFNHVPFLPVKDTKHFCFLKAASILQACQRQHQVIAGCILYKRYILCSQLMDSMSRCLLLLKPNQNQHPAIPIDTDFQLPYGVRLFNVYVHRNDLDQLKSANEKSPYNLTHGRPHRQSSCCCRRKRSVRRTPRRPAGQAPYTSDSCDSGHHVMMASEANPLESISENGSTLCKAVLQDLLLKGFKCCKCIDDEEGEIDEEIGDENGVDEVALKAGKLTNGRLNGEVDEIGHLAEQLHDQSAVNLEKVVPVDQEDSAEFRNVVLHSRQSGTLEGESGIEVTVSDLQSSTATIFEQISVSTARGDNVSRRAIQGVADKQVHKDLPHPGHMSGDSGQFGTSSDLEGLQGMSRVSSKPTEGLRGSNKAQEEHVGELQGMHHYHKEPVVGLKAHKGHDGYVGFQGSHKVHDWDTEGMQEVHKDTGGHEEVSQDMHKTCERTAERLKGHPDDHGNMLCDASVSQNHGNGIYAEHDVILGQRGILGGDKRTLSGLHEGQGGRESNRRGSREKSRGVAVEENLSSRTRSDDEGSIGTADGNFESREVIGGDSGPSHYFPSEGDNKMQSRFPSVSNARNLNAVSVRDSSDDRGLQGVTENDGGKQRTAKRPADNGCCEFQGQEKPEKPGLNKERAATSKCCEVDGLVHANLFVQAHSDVVLILLTECDVHQSEDVVKALWNTSLSQLGELDMLMRHSSKTSEEVRKFPYSYLMYDNFEKTMSGNQKEPFDVDPVFCDTAKIIHAHFESDPQLVEITLRNYHASVCGRRSLTKEVYFKENVIRPTTPQRHQPQVVGSHLERRAYERLLKDHGIQLV